MTVDSAIFFVLVSGFLFAMGGTALGNGFRRYGIPVLLAWAIWGLFLDLNVVVASVILCGGLHLGYGEDKTWIERVFVAFSWGLPAYLMLGFSPWCVAAPVGFLLMFLASNSRVQVLKNLFAWKLVEFVTGAMIGASFVSARGWST